MSIASLITNCHYFYFQGKKAQKNEQKYKEVCTVLFHDNGGWTFESDSVFGNVIPSFEENYWYG